MNLIINKKIRTVLILLFISMVALVVFVFLYWNYIRRPFAISEVRVSNISASSVTVSWKTDKVAASELYVREGDGDWNIVSTNDFETNDDRNGVGQQFEGITHHVTVSNLDPETEYSFGIKNGTSVLLSTPENNTFKTFAAVEQLRVPDPIYGQIVASQGTVEDGIVYFTVTNEQGDSSQLYSAPISENSTWASDVGYILSATGDVIEKEDGSRVDIEVVTSDTTTNFQGRLQDYKPFQTISLDASNIQVASASISSFEQENLTYPRETEDIAAAIGVVNSDSWSCNFTSSGGDNDIEIATQQVQDLFRSGWCEPELRWLYEAEIVINSRGDNAVCNQNGSVSLEDLYSDEYFVSTEAARSNGVSCSEALELRNQIVAEGEDPSEWPSLLERDDTDEDPRCKLVDSEREVNGNSVRVWRDLLNQPQSTPWVFWSQCRVYYDPTTGDILEFNGQSPAGYIDTILGASLPTFESYSEFFGENAQGQILWDLVSGPECGGAIQDFSEEKCGDFENEGSEVIEPAFRGNSEGVLCDPNLSSPTEDLSCDGPGNGEMNLSCLPCSIVDQNILENRCVNIQARSSREIIDSLNDYCGRDSEVAGVNTEDNSPNYTPLSGEQFKYFSYTGKSPVEVQENFALNVLIDIDINGLENIDITTDSDFINNPSNYLLDRGLYRVSNVTTGEFDYLDISMNRTNIDLYLDENNDNFKQLYEKSIGPEEAGLEFQQISEIDVWNLGYGWNLQSINTQIGEPGGNTSAHLLLHAMNAESREVTSIAKYVDGAFKVAIARYDNNGQLLIFGDGDFEILPNDMLFIKSEDSQDYQLYGERSRDVSQFTLSPGWNQISTWKEDQYTATDIMGICDQANVNCEQIIGFEDGSYTNPVVKINEEIVGDFLLKPNNGYFVWVESGEAVIEL